ARAPLGYKHKISFLIGYLEKKGVDISYIKNEYNRINKKLIAFEQKRGKTYRDKVYEELEYLVDTYYTTICSFLELDPIDMETENNLMRRDSVEILLKELQSDYNIHDMKVKVSALDEALKCQFERKIDYLLKECALIENPYYPENFWWRHPSKFRAANDEFGGKIT
ncbi:MAG: hypothetical protein Q7U60_13155, partial [Candidatus Methanoperedens sp.]|nr:hypothetical protein [Candidatus Methanoperedens sp.]